MVVSFRRHQEGFVRAGRGGCGVRSARKGMSMSRREPRACRLVDREKQESGTRGGGLGALTAGRVSGR